MTQSKINEICADIALSFSRKQRAQFEAGFTPGDLSWEQDAGLEKIGGMAVFAEYWQYVNRVTFFKKLMFVLTPDQLSAIREDRKPNPPLDTIREAELSAVGIETFKLWMNDPGQINQYLQNLP